MISGVIIIMTSYDDNNNLGDKIIKQKIAHSTTPNYPGRTQVV